MKTSLIIVIALFAVTLSSQAAELSLKSCSAIEDPVERLACYDKLAGRLPVDAAKASDTTPGKVEPVASKADVIAPTAPAVTSTVPAVEPTPNAEASFGLEHKVKEERPDELQLKWTEKKKDAYGKWIITLENGQVWRQTDSRRFYFTNSEQLVVISRGIFGSFFLEEPERNDGIRVKRIK